MYESSLEEKRDGMGYLLFMYVCMYIDLLNVFILHKSTVQPLVRIILPTFNKLRYLKILVRFMSKKTSVILTATILTLSILAVAVPAPVLAGIPGAPGAPGNPGQAGIGSHGRSANGGPGDNANDDTAIA
jgi:hypothetical protein